MATMQSLTNPNAGSTLQGTLTQPQTAMAGSAAPPAPDAQNMDDAQSNAAIEQYKAAIAKIMASHSDVDYDQLYGAMQQKLDALQPQQKKVNPLVVAATAFGSPQAGAAMLGQGQERQQEEKKINEQRLSFQLEMLDRKAKQQADKGKADDAIATNAEAAKLEEELGRIRSERTARSAENVAKIAAGSRLDVETERGKNRLAVQSMKDTVAREKLNAATHGTANLKLSDVDKAAMMDEYRQISRQYSETVGFNQETMTEPSEEVKQSASAQWERQREEIAARYTAKASGGGSAAVAPPTGGGIKWAEGLAAAKRAREAASATKK
jgi:hypothetical protein